MSLAKRSEKGLLTPDNCVVALIDHQPQMLFGVTSIDRQTLINNVVGFSKAAKLFDVPLILSTVETKSLSGYIWPQLKAQYPDQTPIERSTMNAWDDANFVAAIKATGRKKIVLAGLWTQACVTYPAVQAISDGYEVYVVEDLSGDLDLRTHNAAMRRVEQAGAKPVTWIQVMLEWQRDWALKETYDGVVEIVKNHAGAYGVGVEYAYTMVHGKAQTHFPTWTPPLELAAHR
jgi:nicotinamidase-related amidase